MARWIEDCCPACNTNNMVCNGYGEDLTSAEAIQYRCYGCYTVVTLPQYEGEPSAIADDQNDNDTPEGRPVPSVAGSGKSKVE